MGESWISILAMVAFFILPIIFGNNKKKQRSAPIDKSDFDELLSELGLDGDDMGEDEIPQWRESYRRPEMEVKIVPKKVEHPEVEKVEKGEELKVGSGMSKEEKKKLIIYSEVMSPKYKEY